MRTLAALCLAVALSALQLVPSRAGIYCDEQHLLYSNSPTDEILINNLVSNPHPHPHPHPHLLPPPIRHMPPASKHRAVPLLLAVLFTKWGNAVRNPKPCVV